MSDIVDQLRAECKHVEQSTECLLLEAVDEILALRQKIEMDEYDRLYGTDSGLDPLA